jgi:hypothetical protein
MTIIHTLNLSTSVTKGNYACVPVSAGDYSNVNFNINWDDIFKGKTGYANLKFKLVGNSSATYVLNSDSGYILVNGLAMPFSNTNNLGSVVPVLDSTSTYTSTVTTGTTTYTAQKAYLYGTSCDTNGITVVIPQGYGNLNIQLLDLSNALTVVADPYFIWLYFETE